MALPAGFSELRGTGGVGLVRADLAGHGLSVWWRPGEDLAGARGRGGARVLTVDGVTAVVRDYRHGGWLGRWLGARYAGPGRAFAELAVLAHCAARGVPVVEPLAAVARRRGWSWRLRLATVFWSGARALPDFVTAEPERRGAAVRAVGAAVGRAFDAGLVHPDLHPDNFLVRHQPDGVAVRMLDLDRARVEPGADRDSMLLRMARYPFRHPGRLGPLRLGDVLRFLQGMGLARDRRRATVARLQPGLMRALRRRGLAP